MDFDLAPEYEKLIATVREFGEQHFTCEAVRQWQHDAGLPDEVVRDFVNLDFNGFGVHHVPVVDRAFACDGHDRSWRSSA